MRLEHKVVCWSMDVKGNILEHILIKHFFEQCHLSVIMSTNRIVRHLVVPPIAPRTELLERNHIRHEGRAVSCIRKV